MKLLITLILVLILLNIASATTLEITCVAISYPLNNSSYQEPVVIMYDKIVDLGQNITEVDLTI